MKIRTAFLVVLLGTLALAPFHASAQRQWIVLRDKIVPPSALTPGHAGAYGVTPRALARRAKVLPAGRLLDAADIPVDASTLDAIRATGASIHVVSRWLNAVSVEATPEQLQLVQSLPDVRMAIPVRSLRRTPDPPGIDQTGFLKSTAPASYDYGASLTQLADMHAVELHDLGIVGTGVIIAMLDDGFNNHTVHEALKNIRVIAEHDFVQNDSNTSIAPGEFASQGMHGAGTLSAAGGLAPGHMVGAAPGASFLLAKTEIDSVEIHTEEDTYAAALEWAEGLGADISSSSLGYSIFDAGGSYSWSQMDGRTSIVAKAAIIAMRKGLLVVTAMGNEGTMMKDPVFNYFVHVEKTLVSPADADSIISVGAANSADALASFSGTGPTADARIKPEVVAQGVSVYWANGGTTTGYVSQNGTSCSTPLVAGAAAMVLSAHPELTAQQVRQALMATARQISDGTWQTQVYPNNEYGSGFIHALNAALYFGPVASDAPTITHDAATYTISTRIRSNATLIPDSLRFYYRKPGDASYSFVLLSPTINADEFAAHLPITALSSGSSGFFSFADNAGHSRRSPSRAPDSVFTIGGIAPPIPGSFTLEQNYPNPFNGGTTIRAGIPASGSVDLSVYDLLGRRVRTLFHGIAAPPLLVALWNGKDDAGRPSATGMYLCRLMSAGGVFSRKMTYLR